MSDEKRESDMIPADIEWLELSLPKSGYMLPDGTWLPNVTVNPRITLKSFKIVPGGRIEAEDEGDGK